MAEPESTEKHKEQALTAADACVRLLRERFGARRVILFGSLAGQGAWHGQSDIDLAVEGLTPGEFFRAYGYTLEWNQLRWKTENLSATLTMLKDQLRGFWEVLKR